MQGQDENKYLLGQNGHGYAPQNTLSGSYVQQPEFVQLNPNSYNNQNQDIGMRLSNNTGAQPNFARSRTLGQENLATSIIAPSAVTDYARQQTVYVPQSSPNIAQSYQQQFNTSYKNRYLRGFTEYSPEQTALQGQQFTQPQRSSTNPWLSQEPVQQMQMVAPEQDEVLNLKGLFGKKGTTVGAKANPTAAAKAGAKANPAAAAKAGAKANPAAAAKAGAKANPAAAAKAGARANPAAAAKAGARANPAAAARAKVNPVGPAKVVAPANPSDAQLARQNEIDELVNKRAQKIYLQTLSKHFTPQIKEFLNNKMAEKKLEEDLKIQMVKNKGRGRSNTLDQKQRSSSIKKYFKDVANGFKEVEKPEAAYDKDGKLDMQTPQGQQRLAQIFRHFDTNNDRQLDAEEIYQALRKADQKTSYGYIYRLMREFDKDHDGEINFKEFKLMFLHIQNDTFDDYNSDDEVALYKKNYKEPKQFQQIIPDVTKGDLERSLGKKLNGTLKDEAENYVKNKYSSIIERNRELEEENRLLSQGQNGDLVQKLHHHQMRESQLQAQIDALKRQNYELSQQSFDLPQSDPRLNNLNPYMKPAQVFREYVPVASPPMRHSLTQREVVRQPSPIALREPSPIKVNQYQALGHQVLQERYLTKLEAKEAAKNQIYYQIPKEKLQDPNYGRALDTKFDQSFDRLKRYDDLIPESRMTELSNNMLSA